MSGPVAAPGCPFLDLVGGRHEPEVMQAMFGEGVAVVKGLRNAQRPSGQQLPPHRGGVGRIHESTVSRAVEGKYM